MTRLRALRCFWLASEHRSVAAGEIFVCEDSEALELLNCGAGELVDESDRARFERREHRRWWEAGTERDRMRPDPAALELARIEGVRPRRVPGFVQRWRCNERPERWLLLPE